MNLTVLLLPVGSLQSGARRCFVVPMLLALLVLTFSSTTLAHITLVQPAVRVPGGTGSTQKAVPCGDSMGVGRSADPTVFAPGEEITIEIREDIDHDAYYRVAFDADGEEFPVRTDIDQIVDQASDDPEANVPVDGETVLAYFYDDVSGGSYTFTVNLPNIECDACTLQVTQFMYNSLTNYFQCADIVIAGDVAGEGGEGGAGAMDQGGMGGAGVMNPDGEMGVGGVADDGAAGGTNMDMAGETDTPGMAGTTSTEMEGDIGTTTVIGEVDTTDTAMMPAGMMNPDSSMTPNGGGGSPADTGLGPATNMDTNAAGGGPPAAGTGAATSGTAAAPAVTGIAADSAGSDSDSGGCGIRARSGINPGSSAWTLLLLGLAGLTLRRRP